MKRCHIIILLIVMTGACEPPAGDPAPAPTPPADTSAPALDEAAVTTATIIYMEATPAEIDERRTAYADEQDYYVMTDDLMWYRAEARAFLETQEFAEFVSRERGPLSFSINGQVRRYDFEDVQLLDFIVAYRPGAEPLILAPVDVHQITDFFAHADSVESFESTYLPRRATCHHSPTVVSGTTRGRTRGRRGATFLSLVVSRATRSESLTAAARAAARIESRLTTQAGSGGAGTVCAGGGGPKPNGIRIPPPLPPPDPATPFGGRGPSSAPAFSTRSRASRIAR